MSRSQSILYGSLFGMVSTCTFVLLTTPASGKAMRRNIEQRIQSVRNKGRQSKIWMANMRTRFREVQATLPAVIQSTRDISASVQNYRSELKTYVTDLKKDVEQLRNTINRLS